MMIEIDSTAHTVTFIFDTVPAERVFLAGDFNEWNESSHPMLKEGDHWRLTLSLPPGEYEFKCLVDRVWFNDREAHRFVPNPWGSENSVVVVRYA
jgi:1,4-alpha-glucan branching enzyme